METSPTKFNDIFKKNRGIVIGALHFPPLPPDPGFPGLRVALENAVADLAAFERGGVDGIFLENNYGLTGEQIDTPAAISMGYLIGEICKHTNLPLGASVLWNDYTTALAFAKTYNLSFVRVPVFVDTVEPYCGRIEGHPERVLEKRALLGATNVAIFADIHVKHAKLLSAFSIEESAKRSISSGADAVIVTGNWTGQSPALDELKNVRSAIQDFPLLIGSGANEENIYALCTVANGAIVSTALKTGGAKESERNVKGYDQRIDQAKVEQLVKQLS